MRIRSFAVVFAFMTLLPLAACGGDGGKDIGPYVDAVAADMAKPSDDDSPPLSKEQARCAAEKMVGAIDEDVVTGFDTPAKFVAATDEDLSSLDLDDATLDKMADDFVGCIGGVQFLVDFLDEAGASDDQVDCVRDAITEDALVASVRADLEGETDEAFDEQIGTCPGG